MEKDPHGSPAAIGDPARVADLCDPDRAHEFGLFYRVDGIAHQAVDVARGQPRIGEGGQDGFACELQFGPSGVARELGLADADDRSLPRERVTRTHDCPLITSAPAGRKTGTAPPCSVGSKHSSSSIPIRMSSGLTAMRFDTSRMPSSKS